MFLALAHMVGATQVMGWGGVGVGWGGDGNVPCTCTHGRCYATSCSLHLHTWSVQRKSWDGLGWGGVGMITFLAHEDDTLWWQQCQRAVDALHTQPCSSGGAAFGRLEEHAGCIDLDSPSSPRGDGDGASSEMLYAV